MSSRGGITVASFPGTWSSHDAEHNHNKEESAELQIGASHRVVSFGFERLRCDSDSHQTESVAEDRPYLDRWRNLEEVDVFKAI